MFPTGTEEGGCCTRADCVRLRNDLATSEARIEKLLATVRDQARALEELTNDCPSWAPTIATLYWLYAPTQWAREDWPAVWNRLSPLVNALGDLPAAKLTPMAWDKHRAFRKLTAKGRYGEPIKDSLLNQELGRAKQLLSWAVENKLLKFNPLTPARAVATVGHRDTRLTAEQIDRLLEAADDVVDRRLSDGDDDGFRSLAVRAYILCCHDSMLRPGEALALRRDHIGTDGRVDLAARATKGKRHRSVFLTPRTMEAIAALPAHGPLVFVDQHGRPILEKRMWGWWRQCCVAAGVDVYAAPGEHRITRHDLRASGATTADENGARATAVRDALGHRHLATTEKYLRSEQRDNARSVADVMIGVAGRKGPRRAVRRALKKFAVVDQSL